MTSRVPCERGRLVLGLRALALLAAAGLWLAPGRAQAQYGGGFGIGFGIGRTVPPPEMFLNQRALLNASQATFGPRGFSSANPYANGNAYFNNIRSNDFTQRYSIDSRAESQFRSIRRPTASSTRPRTTPTPAPATAATAAPAPAPAAANPVLPLASFFNAVGMLIWPEGSPTTGELGPKREASDQATGVVYREVQQRGFAPIGSVTDARTKLVDYGQPALAFMRENTTSRVADGFHLFLLSLYESLGQAATPPQATAAR